MSPDDRTWCEPYECSQSARSCARMWMAGQAAKVGRGPDATRRNAACETCADGAERAAALELVQLSARDRAESLRMAAEWLPKLRGIAPLLFAAQDGMTEADVPNECGVFLGGSTEWKLATMRRWGEFCRRTGRYYHVARVNSGRRIAAAKEAGADSIDGSSASRFALSLPRLQRAMAQEAMVWS